jgi:hypothetical protein
MARTSECAGIASRYRCTRRCTPSSASSACRHRSNSSGFNRQVTQSPCEYERRNVWRPNLVLDVSISRKEETPNGVFHGASGKSGSKKQKKSSTSQTASHGGGTSPSLPCSNSIHCPGAKDKSRDARRRDPRVNGADIYVCRVTKAGMGNSKPCWRCVGWCKWAGVKRIFHWNGDELKWDVVKVNNIGREQYETHADMRLSAGLVGFFFPVCTKPFSFEGESF